MSVDFQRSTEKLKKQPAVTEAAIEAYNLSSGPRLPDEYLEFLRISNGAEGFIGKKYVMFWPLEELLELNKSYEVDKHAPGLFLFGSSGGGEAYAFDTRFSMSIVQVPFVGMDLREAWHVAQTFHEFLHTLEKAS
jgi:hypothetical protein